MRQRLLFFVGSGPEVEVLTMKKLPRTLGLAIRLMIACTLLGACSPYGGICDDTMNCEGGNAADYDACVITYEAQEEKSNLYGCGDLLDRYLECFEVQASCKNDNWTDEGDCGDERQDFNKCID
jgi:hypothetical protein